MKTTARVRITLDIALPQGWSDKATVDEVLKQAKQSGEQEARLMIQKSKVDNVIIVGHPIVKIIMVDEEGD